MESESLWLNLKQLVLSHYEGGVGYCSLRTFAARLAESVNDSRSDWLAGLASKYEHLFLLFRDDDDELRDRLLGLSIRMPPPDYFGVEINAVLNRHSIKYAALWDDDGNSEHLGIVSIDNWLVNYCSTNGIECETPELFREILAGTWGLMPLSHVGFSYVVPEEELKRFITRFLALLDRLPVSVLDELIQKGERAGEDRIQKLRTLDAIAEADSEASSYADNWHLQTSNIPPQYDPLDSDDPEYVEERYLSIDIDDSEQQSRS